MDTEATTEHPSGQSGMPAIAGILGGILGVAAVLISTVALVASGGSGSGEADGQVSAAGAKSAIARTVDIELGDLFIKPANLAVEPGTELTLNVMNHGGIPHDLSIKGGPKTPLLNPGQSVTLKAGVVDGRLDLLCTVPGHADAGMKAAVAVTPGAKQGATVHAMSAEEMDKSYLAGVAAYPAKTKGLGNVDAVPVIQNGVKVFELTADEIEWEVAPGDVRKGMAYNGMVPGPAIRVNVGDRVRIVLNNKLNESTAIHFHGLTVPNGQDGVPGLTQPLVKPGASHTYEFTVRDGGSHMYHSHMNGALQIPAGLLGAFVVTGPNEPKVSQDLLMVLNDGPLGYTINGKGFPATQPIVAKKGERIRIRYMNEGLQIHPMHLHGMVQTVYARDGHPLPQPYLADTVLVAPGERIDVFVDATEVGLWAYHCHILTHAENEAGMFGMVTVMIVQ